MVTLGPAGVGLVAFVGLSLVLSGLVGVLASHPRSEPFVFFPSAVCALLGGGTIAFLCAGIA